MAGISRRTRRTTPSSNPNEEEVVENNKDVKSKNGRTARVLTVPTSPVEMDSIGASTNGELSAIEAESSAVTQPSGTEEVSSNASESASTAASSEKSTSETSVTSDETLQKTKDELIRTAHDLDSQLQELIKIYKDEKKIFLDKSINLLETESHPDWLERIEELRVKRLDSIKTANERHRLKVESILAEYDFVLKNISDEFQAAENEIIDEFTTKRKKKAASFSGLETIERAIEAPATVTTTNSTSAFAVDEIQVQNDLSAINRIIKNSSKTSPSSPPPQQQSQQNAEVSV